MMEIVLWFRVLMESSMHNIWGLVLKSLLQVSQQEICNDGFP